jgi:hypothetical protein
MKISNKHWLLKDLITNEGTRAQQESRSRTGETNKESGMKEMTELMELN